jgi:protein arginine N-methyltransferase 1
MPTTPASSEHSYSIGDYDVMLADAARTGAHVAAIERAVRPGDVVVEIGAGVGTFAVVAARAGARHVYAIESSPVIVLGPEFAAANGCADRITFVWGDSRRITLPERGDVLVEDLRGVLPLFSEHITSVVDARARLVRPGATVVPSCDTLWAAPCEADDRFRAAHVTPGAAPFGINRSVLDARVREDWHRARLSPQQLLSAAVRWGAVSYATATSPDLSGRLEWTLERAGHLEGVCVWFDADLGFGCGFSNGPGEAPTVHGQAFFPFPRAIEAGAGDHLATELRATLKHGEYLFGWDSEYEPVPGSGRAAARFRQSNLLALSAALEVHARRLAASDGNHPPGDSR